MRKRSGVLHREFVTSSMHFFDDGEYEGNHQDNEHGEYTDMVWFEYEDGTLSRRYREVNAPKWMQDMLNEVGI